MRARVKGTEGYVQELAGYKYLSPTNKSMLYFPIRPNCYERCVDEVHPNHPNTGGPLSILRLTSSFNDAHLRTGFIYKVGPYTVYDCKRRVLPSSFEPILSDNSESLRNEGAAAWNKFKPKLAKVNLGQTIAEITDIPKLFKRGCRYYKDLGDKYLQYQFGWKPFIKDLTDSLKVYKNVDQHLAKMQKHNDKWLKRGDTISRTTSYAVKTAYVTPINYLTVDSVSGERETYERTWFDGRFRYYIPGLTNGSWGKLRLARKLFGVELTPSLAYEIIPWSWLADWFGNVGDVVSNYTSITDENMCAKYAYIMRHTRNVTRCIAGITGRMFENNKTTYQTDYASSEFISERKTRCSADPFGFDSHMADFSAYQTSILGALGVSRQKWI